MDHLLAILAVACAEEKAEVRNLVFVEASRQVNDDLYEQRHAEFMARRSNSDPEFTMKDWDFFGNPEPEEDEDAEQ